MFTYYSMITLITLAALLVLCVLVRDNSRIGKKQKIVFYLSYLFIGLAAAAEWAGVQLNGNESIPQCLLLAVKCADFTLTPMTGGALVRQTGASNRRLTALNILLVGNTVFQLIAVFFGWMTVIDATNHYSPGPLYFIYILVYLAVFAIVIVEFWHYGKGFARQNRYSLYSILVPVLTGILMQEVFDESFRTAYISMTLGAAMLFIHYVEYAQLDDADRIKQQKQLLYRDSMTGLFSRYAYSGELKQYDAKGALPDDLAVFSIDINRLKTVNDSLGHAAGDELICGAADCIQKVFGACGRCYRTGGDEFIVLAHADREKAEALIRQLAKEMKAWKGEVVPRLSLSAGFALASEHEGITTEKLIIIADKGMYDEKSRFYRQRADDNR